MAPRQDDLHHYETTSSEDYLLSYQRSMDEFVTPRTKLRLRRFLYVVSFLTYALCCTGLLYHSISPPKDQESSGSMSSLAIERCMIILWMVGITTIVLSTVFPIVRYYSKSLVIRARHIPLTFVSSFFGVLTAVTLCLIYWNPSNCRLYNYPLGFFYLFSLLPFPVRVLRLLKVFVWKGGINDPMSIISFLHQYQEWTTFQADLSVLIQQQTYDMKKIRQPITCIYCLHAAPHTYATTNHDENCGLNSSSFLFNDQLTNPSRSEQDPSQDPHAGHSHLPLPNPPTIPSYLEEESSGQGISIQQHSTRVSTPNPLNTPTIRTTSNQQSIMTAPGNGTNGQFSYNPTGDFSLGESTAITQEVALQKAHAALQDPHSAEARRYMDRINGALYNFKDNFDDGDDPAKNTPNPGALPLRQPGGAFDTDGNQFDSMAHNQRSAQHGVMTPQKVTQSTGPAQVPSTELKSTLQHNNGRPAGFPNFSFASMDSGSDPDHSHRFSSDFSFGANSINLQLNYGMGTSINNMVNNNTISNQYVTDALMLSSPGLPIGHSSSDINTDATSPSDIGRFNRGLNSTASHSAATTVNIGSGANFLQQQQVHFVQTLAKCAQNVHENHHVLNSMMDNIRHYNNTHQSTTLSLHQTPHKAQSSKGVRPSAGDDTIPVDLPPNDMYRFTRSNECTCLSVYEASYFNEDNQLYTLYDYYSHNLHIESDIAKANEKNKLLTKGVDMLNRKRRKNRHGNHNRGDPLLQDSDDSSFGYHNDILVPSEFLYDGENEIDPCPLHSYASDTDRNHFQVDNFFDDGGDSQRRLNRDLQHQQLRLKNQQITSSLPSSPSSFSPDDYIFASTNPLKQFARCSTSNIVRLSLVLLVLLGLVTAVINYIIAQHLTDDASTYFCAETTKVSQVAMYIGASHLITAAGFFLLVKLVHSVWSIYSSTAEYYVVIITHLLLLVVQIASLIASTQNEGRLFAGRFFFWSMSLRVSSTLVALLVTPISKITQTPTPQLVPVDEDGNIILERSSVLADASAAAVTTAGQKSTKKDQTSPRLNRIGSTGASDEQQPKVMKLRLPKQVTDIRVYDLINRYIEDHMMLLTIEIHRFFQLQSHQSILSLHQSNHLDSQYLEGLDVDVFHALLNKPSVMDISLFHSITPQPPPSFDLLIRNPHGYSSFASYLSRSVLILHCYVHTQSILLLLHTVVDNMQYILDIVARYNQHLKEQMDYQLFSKECDAFSNPTTTTSSATPQRSRPEHIPKFLQPMITMPLYQLLTQLGGCLQSFSTLYLESHTHSTSHPPTITVTHQPILHNSCPHQPPNSQATDKWSCNYPLIDCVLCTITPYLSGSFVDANRSLMTLVTQISQQVQNLQLNEYSSAFNRAFNTTTASASQQASPTFPGSANQRVGEIQSHYPPTQLIPTDGVNRTASFNSLADQTTPEFSSILAHSSKLPPIQLTTQFSNNPSHDSHSTSSTAQDISIASTPVKNYKPARFATHHPSIITAASPGNALAFPPSTAASFIQSKDFSSLLDKGNATSVLNRSYIARNQPTTISSDANPTNPGPSMLIGSHSALHMFASADRNGPTTSQPQHNNHNYPSHNHHSGSNLADLLASTSSPTLPTYRAPSAHSVAPSGDELNSTASNLYQLPAASPPSTSHQASKLLTPNMQLIDPEDVPFFHEQFCNFAFFSQVSHVISSLYGVLKELETGSRNALCVHYSLYGSQSIHWKLLYYRIITINHWCNILHTCGLTEDLTL